MNIASESGRAGFGLFAVLGILIGGALLIGCGSGPEITPDTAIPEPPGPIIEEKTPLPELPDKEEPPTVVYTVEPAPRLEDGHGYVELEYIEENGGGKPQVAVGFGRREIGHADTKWYTFTFIIDGRRYTLEGRHSVPFVKGRDGLWWNETMIELPFSFTEELSVVVTDRYAREEYRFGVERTYR
jgi:hypothetical protein